MVVNDRLKIDTDLLTLHLFYHGLRVYDQVYVWHELSNLDKDLFR